MKIAIHQPEHLPYYGFFNKMSKADTFIILDDVQFLKNTFQNRNRIKNAKGEQWLTVPIKLEHHSQKINEIKIDNSKDWQKKNLLSIKYNYQKTPYFKQYYPEFEKIYSKKENLLVDFNLNLIKFFIDAFEIKTNIILCSTLNINTQKTQRLIDICQKTNGLTYLSGNGADYLDKDSFPKNNIKLEINHFTHPIYPQPYGKFLPYMCSLDLLFNCGPDSKKYFKKNE